MRPRPITSVGGTGDVVLRCFRVHGPSSLRPVESYTNQRLHVLERTNRTFLFRHSYPTRHGREVLQDASQSEGMGSLPVRSLHFCMRSWSCTRWSDAFRVAELSSHRLVALRHSFRISSHHDGDPKTCYPATC